MDGSIERRLELGAAPRGHFRHHSNTKRKTESESLSACPSSRMCAFQSFRGQAERSICPSDCCLELHSGATRNEKKSKDPHQFWPQAEGTPENTRDSRPDNNAGRVCSFANFASSASEFNENSIEQVGAPKGHTSLACVSSILVCLPTVPNRQRTKKRTRSQVEPSSFVCK